MVYLQQSMKRSGMRSEIIPLRSIINEYNFYKVKIITTFHILSFFVFIIL
jgi:hypothetical protein